MSHECKPYRVPQNYAGLTWEGWHSAGFGRSRDSDVLEESNFQVASAALLKLAEDAPRHELSVEMLEQLDDCLSVQIVCENHWAVGWVEWIAIHDSNVAAIELAKELCERANSYPILNESHFSNLEYERAMEFWSGLSLSDKVDMCRDCGVSIFAARRNSALPDRLWESLVA